MNDTITNIDKKRGRPTKNVVWPISGQEFTAKSLHTLNPLLSTATIVKKLKEAVQENRISKVRTENRVIVYTTI